MQTTRFTRLQLFNGCRVEYKRPIPVAEVSFAVHPEGAPPYVKHTSTNIQGVNK